MSRTRGEREGEERSARVRDILPGLLRRLGIAKEVASQEALAAWGPAVGPHIATVTRATAVANGVLFVSVRSSAWLSELNMMKRELLRKLNAGCTEGRIEWIVFRLDGR